MRGRFLGKKHTQKNKDLVSVAVTKELIGKCGDKARRWKGEDAGYVAKHMWLVKHYGKANKCENPMCTYRKPKRFEWANISKEYKRDRNDYVMLCCSCHRKWDMGKIEVAICVL